MPFITGMALDLTGVNPANLIPNEVHTFSQPADRIFVPNSGPFFLTGLQIYSTADNSLLQPMIDYRPVHLLVDASMMSSQDVVGGLVILNNTVPGVKLVYQAIGGDYQQMSTIIQNLLNATPPNTLITWGQILNLPVQFPPAAHKTNLFDIWNMGGFITVIERLRSAIVAGDGPAFNAIYQYINTRLANDYVTQAELEAAIPPVVPPRLYTFQNVAALRAASGMVTDQTIMYVTFGSTTMYDSKGRIYVWNATSTAVDDGDYVIQPTVVSGAAPGRFVSLLYDRYDLSVDDGTSGNPNVINTSIYPAPVSQAALIGWPLRVKLLAPVTGACTINANGLGAYPLRHANGAEILATELTAGVLSAVFDGTQYVLQSVGYFPAPNDSANLTGNPKAPTPAVTTTDNSIATMAVVHELSNTFTRIAFGVTGGDSVHPLVLNAVDTGTLNLVSGNAFLQFPPVAAGLTFAFVCYGGASSATLYPNPGDGSSIYLGDNEAVSQYIPTGGTGVFFSDGVNWLALDYSGFDLTRAQHDNSKRAATTEYVDVAIANLIDSAPSLLSTLNELAAALNDDPNAYNDLLTMINARIKYTDIVNDVVTGGASVPLSAQQGVILKGLIDTETAARLSTMEQLAGGYWTDTGAVNAIVLTLNPVPPNQAFLIGTPIRLLTANAMTGATTINVNGFGAYPLVYTDGSAIQNGDVFGSSVMTVVFDGSKYQMQSVPGAMALRSVVVGAFNRNGIDRDLSTGANRLSGVSLKTIVAVGEYSYDNTCTDAPPLLHGDTFVSGIMKVSVNGGAVHQMVQLSETYGGAGTPLNRDSMYLRSSPDGGTTWHGWFSGDGNELPTTAAIVVDNTEIYTGGTLTNSLFFASIARDSTSTAFCYLNGEYRSIPVDSVASIPGNYSAQYLNYVYLHESSPGNFAIELSATPPDWNFFKSQGVKRPYTVKGGDVTRTFLGVALYAPSTVFNALTTGWQAVRTWHQDYGFIQVQQTDAYLETGLGALPTQTAQFTEMVFRERTQITNANNVPHRSSDNAQPANILFIAWPGEEIELDLSANIACSNDGSAMSGQINVELMSVAPDYGSYTAIRGCMVNNHGINDCLTNNFFDAINPRLRYRSPALEAYITYVQGNILTGSGTIYMPGNESADLTESGYYGAAIQTLKLHDVVSTGNFNIYYTPPPAPILVSSSTSDLDLRALFHTATGNWPEAVVGLTSVVFVVESGVTVHASSTAAAAVTLPAAWPSTASVVLINYGTIVGAGGNGGHVNAGSLGPGTPTPGLPGGDAIEAYQTNFNVINIGTLGGGGGGGGAGDSGGVDNGGSNIATGGSGGGGAGIVAGGAGVNGVAVYGSASSSGNGGNAGTATTGGGGGAGYTGGGGDDAVISGWGGTGGDLGNNGGAGTYGGVGDYHTGYAAGGAAGYAIRKNGNGVTFTNYGTLAGLGIVA